MSGFPIAEPDCLDHPAAGPDLVIVPRSHDVGGFRVARALPSGKRRLVGPLIFLGRMGPGELMRGSGVDVRPRPHIGLATVTCLFEGAVAHRDGLGTGIVIRPGAVNRMTAGRGTAHSGRTPPAERAADSRLYGIRSWFALPRAGGDRPRFLPSRRRCAAGARRRIDPRPRDPSASSAARAARSPCRGRRCTSTRNAPPGARLPLPRETGERALFVLDGTARIAGEKWAAGRLLVFRARDRVVVTASGPARVLVPGSAAMDGPRHIWRNFVSSSKERIEQAKADWRARRLAPVPGDGELISFPEM